MVPSVQAQDRSQAQAQGRQQTSSGRHTRLPETVGSRAIEQHGHETWGGATAPQTRGTLGVRSSGAWRWSSLPLEPPQRAPEMCENRRQNLEPIFGGGTSRAGVPEFLGSKFPRLFSPKFWFLAGRGMVSNFGDQNLCVQFCVPNFGVIRLSFWRRFWAQILAQIREKLAPSFGVGPTLVGR